ncbi:MAG: zinc-binding dehydrogenase [Bacteroidota bacterium]
MANTMRAMIYLGPEQIELRTVPIPEPSAGELLVRVRAATTCGTDVKTYRRGHPKFPPPFIFGHEFGGDIVGVGEGVRAFREGMRVTANVFAECGECFYCKRGQGNLCANLVYNFGAFAEYMTIPASIVRRTTFVIPSHISYEQAALLEPLVTVVHGWHKVRFQHGETVVLLGAGGPISLMYLQLALRAGASRVIAIGHSSTRLAVAGKLGAGHLVNSRETDPVVAVHDLTGGYGADVVIECAGTQSTWQSSLELVRKGGRVLWFGGLPGGTRVKIDAARVHYGEIDLLNMHGGTSEDACEAFELITSGAMQVSPMLNGELPLEKVELALQKMIAGEVVKMVIRPDLGNSA